ncbi:MAG: hypothetical protein ACT4OI_07515 [Methanobacteriota archaeon]
MPRTPYPAYRTADFSNIFSGTLRVFFRHPAEFVLPYLALSLATGLFAYALLFETLAGLLSGLDPTAPPAAVFAALNTFLLGVAVLSLVSLVLSSFLQGVVSHYAVLRHRGSSISFAFSVRRAARRFPVLLAGILLYTGILVGVLAIAFVPLFAGSATLNFALLGLGILAMIPAAIIALYLALALSLVVPSIMMEDVGVLASFRRSWQMTKGHKLSIFAALFVLGLISGAITIAVAFPVGAFADPIASFFVQLIVGGILGSWNVIAPAVTYDLVAREPRYAPYRGWVGPPGAYPAPPSGPP